MTVAPVVPSGGSLFTASRWNWNFLIVAFVVGGNPQKLAKNSWSKDKNHQETQPICDAASSIWTWETLVEGLIPLVSKTNKLNIKSTWPIRSSNLQKKMKPTDLPLRFESTACPRENKETSEMTMFHNLNYVWNYS